MAMASPGSRIVPETPSKLMGGLNLSITPEDCDDSGYGAWPLDRKPEPPSSGHGSPFSSAANEYTPHNVDLISDSSTSSASSQKGKLPVVLEESESFSNRKEPSVWDVSPSSSSFSITSSSASSTQALFHRGDKSRHNHKARESWKHQRERGDGKKVTFMSVLLWPLKKLRDGYISCMISLDGAGDLSGLVHGSNFSTSAKYFSDTPMSKTDAKNYG